MQALIVALTLSASPAPDLGIDLDWVGPEPCADDSAVLRELARFRVDEGQQRATIRAKLEALDGPGYRVDLRIELDDGVVDRRFEAATCALASSATALMIAVALDPVAALDELDAPESDAPAPEPEPEPKPDPKPAPPPTGPPRLGLVAQLAAQGGVGPLPGFGAGLFASAGLRVGAARVELLTNLGVPRVEPVDPRDDAGVRLHYWTLGLRGCGEPRLRRAAVAFPLCLGVEAGPLTAVGFGLDENRRASSPWVATAASAGVSWALTAVFGLFAGVEGWVGLTRPRTRVEGVGTIHQPDAGGFRLRAGVEFRWPNNLRARRPR